MAAITAPPALLTSDTLVAANIFLGHMADHFRLRTSRKVCGIRFNTMSRMEAMSLALPTFDGAIDMTPFGDPSEPWDKAHAAALVDEEMSYWGEG